MRYQVVYGAHPNVAEVHLALPGRLTSGTYSFTLADADQATGEHAPLIRELLEIPGAAEVFVHGCCITIHKDAVYSWDQVLFEALLILRKTFGDLEELADPILTPPDPDCPTVHTPCAAIKH